MIDSNIGYYAKKKMFFFFFTIYKVPQAPVQFSFCPSVFMLVLLCLLVAAAGSRSLRDRVEDGIPAGSHILYVT